MFISGSTQYDCQTFKAHATAQDAVAYLLESLGSDYQNDFWANEDGTKILKGNRSLDFGVNVYDDAAEAIKLTTQYADLDLLPTTLRKLADAIEQGILAGLLE